MTERTYTGYLLVDWRDDDLRFRKTKPSESERGPTEYPVKVEMTVDVPDLDTPTLAAELNVPEAEVRQAAHDDILATVENGEPPWTEHVRDGLDAYDDAVAAAVADPTSTAYDDAVNTLVGYVHRRAEGYPSPAAVEEHVETELDRRVRGEADL